MRWPERLLCCFACITFVKGAVQPWGALPKLAQAALGSPSMWQLHASVDI